MHDVVTQVIPTVESNINPVCLTLTLACRKIGSMTQTTHQAMLPGQAWHCCLKG